MTDTYKRRLAWCLIGSMLFTLPYTHVKAVELNSKFLDTKGHWAEQAIDRMSIYEIVQGYNGLFRPNDLMTRGEMAVVIDRIMDYQRASDNIFADVEEAFYKDAILKAYEEGLLLADEMALYPRKNITREEVAYMLYHAFELERDEKLLTFKDHNEISEWAKEAVTSLAAQGILVGDGENLRPKDAITRAEVITLLSRLLGSYYNKAGYYDGQMEGNVLINTADANLKDAVISGDLIIAEGVGEGDIILENVVVKGRTIIKGGGVNSIKVKGKSQLNDVIMAKDDAPVRLVVEETSQVQTVTVDKKSTDVIIAGKLDKIVFNSEQTKLTMQDANIKSMEIIGAGVSIEVKGKTTIDVLNVMKEAISTHITVDQQAKVQTIEAEAKSTIEGSGKVTTVKANANDIKIQTSNTRVEVAEGITGVTAGNKEIIGGTTTNTTPSNTGGSQSQEDKEDTPSEEEKPSEEETPVEAPIHIAKVESVKNGVVKFELNKALDKALTLEQVHIVCTSGGKDMTILNISTADNKVYELTTSYYDDNTYRLYVYLEDEKIVEKDFVSKYDCAEISSMQIIRNSETTAELSYVSDAPGKFYYGLYKESGTTRNLFTKEPTVEELIADGIETTMNLHVNTQQIESLEKGVAYTLYYVAVDASDRVTPVKSIRIPGEVVQSPVQNEIKIEEATPYYRPGDLFDENYYFVFKLSEPTKTALTLDQFKIVCPQDGALSLGRVETKDYQTYTVYMKPGYIPKEKNTFKVTISFEDGTSAEKGFYVDLTAPVIKSAKVEAVSENQIQVEIDSDEPGTLYYKILDNVSDDISAKDPTEIYKTGTKVNIGWGLNVLKEIEAKEGQWFCYATEDELGNRQFYYGYKQVPQYIAPEEPEENAVKIIDIAYEGGWGTTLTVTFNQYVSDNRVDKSNIAITGLSGKFLTTVSWSGEKLVINIPDPSIKFSQGEHTLRLMIDGKPVEGIFIVK